MNLLNKNNSKKDCGVIAAFNAATWCRSYKSYEQVEKLARSCGYSPEKGIYPFQFHYLLQKLNLPAKKIKPKSRRSLESRLDSGKFFIFIYYPTGKANGHVITSFKDHTGKIRIFNPDSKRRSWRTFMDDIAENGLWGFTVYEVPKRDLVK